MVERGATPRIPEFRKRVLRALRAMTTPLLPDDYLALMDPRWSTRELTGTIVEIRPEAPDAATVVIRPASPGAGRHPRGDPQGHEVRGAAQGTALPRALRAAGRGADGAQRRGPRAGVPVTERRGAGG